MEAVTASPPAPELDSPELYSNRELSWLQFNERVLELAEDESLPLLERVKFLAIYASNLDEFYMVRVAGLHDQVDAGSTRAAPTGCRRARRSSGSPSARASSATRHSRQWESVVRPQLAEQGIRVVDCSDCAGRGAGGDRPPVLRADLPGAHAAGGRARAGRSRTSRTCRCRSACWLRDPVSGTETFARVKVPKEVLPRFVPIGDDVFVPLESVIARHLDELFPGMEILRHDFFRVTRDADFTVSDEADDLLRAVEDELRRRRFGEVVRLEVGLDDGPGHARLPDRAARDRRDRR